MRGEKPNDGKLFSYGSLEERVPADHPLRSMRRLTDEALAQLSTHFDEIYSATGRPSIPPEFLLRAMLLQLLYSVRSERLLIEQLDYNLLFRWFVGLDIDAEVWNPTTFTKNKRICLSGTALGHAPRSRFGCEDNVWARLRAIARDHRGIGRVDRCANVVQRKPHAVLCKIERARRDD